MKRRIIEAAVFLVILIAASLPLWKDFILTPVSNEAFADDAHSLMTLAWNPDADAPPLKAYPGAIGVIVAYHSLKKNDDSPLMAASPILDNPASAVRAASKSLRQKLEAHPQFAAGAVSIHFILSPDRVRSDLPARKGFTYSIGLHGLMYCSADSCSAIPGPVIHARGEKYETTVKRLEKGLGARFEYSKQPDGIYRFEDIGFISTDAAKEPRRLYRASVLARGLSGDDIIAACKTAGDFLLRMQMTSGRWNYEYDSSRDRLNAKDYNLLRHAGTCYSLYQLFQSTGDRRYSDAADRGLVYLKGFLQADPNDPERLYVREGKSVKLGGAGLALMAMAEKAVASKPDEEDERLMRGLVRHLLLSQNNDGSIESYYAPKGKAKARRSIYYPGEAMVGLIRYYQLHPDRKDCLDAVRRAADYLIDRRWNLFGLRFNVPPDAWLMLALEELHQSIPDEKYAQYVFDIAEGMGFDQWIGHYPQKDFTGGYFPAPPQVTPAGARGEGITAAWLIAKRLKRTGEMERIEAIIRSAVGFQISCLIRPEFSALYPNPETALGAFRHSPLVSKTRIDYNQHNISGLLVAAKIIGQTDR